MTKNGGKPLDMAKMDEIMTVRDIPRGVPRVRPKDSATLILLDTTSEPVRVLMGRRHAAHVFMPGKYVFPGGRVDPADARVTPATALKPQVAERLQKYMGVRASATRARAIAIAAVRETLEETGFMIGAPAGDVTPSRSPDWRPFAEKGLAPALHRRQLIARAVTPPGLPRRFDSRFFVMNARHISGRADLGLLDEAELLDVDWLTFQEALSQDMARVTKTVLHIINARLRPDGEVEDGPVPFWRMKHTRFLRADL